MAIENTILLTGDEYAFVTAMRRLHLEGGEGIHCFPLTTILQKIRQGNFSIVTATSVMRSLRRLGIIIEGPDGFALTQSGRLAKTIITDATTITVIR